MSTPFTTMPTAASQSRVTSTNTLGMARESAPSRRRHFVRRVLRWIMAGLSAFVAAYAVMLLVAVPLRPPLMQLRFNEHPVATTLHLAGGAVVIVLAQLQLSLRLRRRYAGFHRWSGRVYAIGVLASGLAGLALARISQGGIPAHLGFGMLSIVWIFTTAMGVYRIRSGDQQAHEEWMLRSAALTFAAVTLRIYIPLGFALGLPYERAYQAIAWACWVPNLVVVEWLMRSSAIGIRANESQGATARG